MNKSKKIKQNSSYFALLTRNGTILFFMFFVIVVLATLALAFNKLFIQVQQTSYRFEIKTITRSIAEAAIEEAVARLRRAFQIQDSEESKWLIEKRSNDINIKVPQISNLLSTILRNAYHGEVQVKAKIYEFRDSNSKGNKYFEKEGVGTLEIHANVIITHRNSNKIIQNFNIVRHYDYKIANLVSKRDNSSERKSYSPSFILDYVLFIKDAINEFIETFGKAYNVPGIELIIDQSKLLATPNKLGKIYFGGTESLNNSISDIDKSIVEQSYIFINTCEKVTSIVPKFEKEFHRIGLDECIILFPELSKGKKYLGGLEGVFGAVHLPLQVGNYEKNHQLKDLMSYARQAIRESLLQKARNLTKKSDITADMLVEFEAPGIYLLSDNNNVAGVEANANYIFEGAIRQRFFSFVYFYLDLSKVSKAGRDIVEQLKHNKLPCIPVCEKAKEDSTVYNFTKNLEKLNKTRPQHIHNYISRYDDNFLYKGGQDGSSSPNKAIFNKPLPKFYTFDNQTINDYSKANLSAYPYNARFSNLRVAAFESFDLFKKSGFYDEKNKKLYLNGIYEISDIVELGKGINGSIEFEGQGIIIAQGFKIYSGLKKALNSNNTPLCILYAKFYDIIIETSDRIEASLIALSDKPNQKIGVIANNALRLYGNLAVDRLYLGSWKANVKHIIEYDPSLKLPDKDIYKIYISNYISFQRIYEN